MRILVIGREDDPHVAAVLSHTDALECPTDVLDPSRDALTFAFAGGQASCALTIRGTSHDAASYGAVWWRKKAFTISELNGQFTDPADAFADKEWRHALSSLDAFMPNAVWVNSPSAQAAASLKPRQLLEASRVGFAVPPSVIGNEPKAIQAQVGSWRDAIYKPLAFFIFPDGKVIYTSKIGAGEVDQADEALARAPGIYQQQLRKHHELRVTVVGRECFASRVEPPSDGDAAVDWRHAQFEDIFSPTDCPPAIRDAILLLQERLGLLFGAYDFVVDESGTAVFLEVNPAGQWLWIEEKTGLQVSLALARMLVSLAQRRGHELPAPIHQGANR